MNQYSRPIGVAARGRHLRPAGSKGAGRIALALLTGLAQKVARTGASTLEHVVEKRRVKRTRRNPTPLRVAVKSAKNILIVCHGNIIRSAFAARLVAQTVGDRTTA